MALAASVAAAAAGAGAIVALLAALMALTGIAVGYVFGRWDGGTAESARKLMLRVADELSQYRAFTRLLRDQGGRIVETSSDAATAIVAGLAEMETAVARLRTLVERPAPDVLVRLPSLLDAVGAPVLGMLSQLQFQDVTRQQIGFLAQLSLILDEHMLQLAAHLGDRRSPEQIARFSEKFDEALQYCVMNSQRNDHHAASGIARREEVGSKYELF